MREIKFRVYDESLKTLFYVGAGSDYTLAFGNEKPLLQIYSNSGEFVDQLLAKNVMQYTGLKDRNGTDIYESDLVNVFYTFGNGEHNHDCIYKASIDPLHGLTLTFVNLLWRQYGHNQYPLSTTLSPEYNGLSRDNRNQNYDKIAVTDSYGENHIHGTRWKERDYSNYIEVIGNIYENPELLGDGK